MVSINWQGPGWYAAAYQFSRDGSDFYCYQRIGPDRPGDPYGSHTIPTVPAGMMGAPRWYDVEEDFWGCFLPK